MPIAPVRNDLTKILGDGAIQPGLVPSKTMTTLRRAWDDAKPFDRREMLMHVLAETAHWHRAMASLEGLEGLEDEVLQAAPVVSLAALLAGAEGFRDGAVSVEVKLLEPDPEWLNKNPSVVAGRLRVEDGRPGWLAFHVWTDSDLDALKALDRLRRLPRVIRAVKGYPGSRLLKALKDAGPGSTVRLTGRIVSGAAPGPLARFEIWDLVEVTR